MSKSLLDAVGRIYIAIVARFIIATTSPILRILVAVSQTSSRWQHASHLGSILSLFTEQWIGLECVLISLRGWGPRWRFAWAGMFMYAAIGLACSDGTLPRFVILVPTAMSMLLIGSAMVAQRRA